MEAKPEPEGEQEPEENRTGEEVLMEPEEPQTGKKVLTEPEGLPEVESKLAPDEAPARRPGKLPKDEPASKEFPEEENAAAPEELQEGESVQDIEEQSTVYRTVWIILSFWHPCIVVILFAGVLAELFVLSIVLLGLLVLLISLWRSRKTAGQGRNTADRFEPDCEGEGAKTKELAE